MARRFKSLFVAAAVLAVVGMLFGPASRPALAAGMLVADGGFGGSLQVKEHSVKVTSMP